MKPYKVQASSMTATYACGEFVANSPEEACDMARDKYANSALGRALKDANAFRYYTVSQFMYEDDDNA